MLEELYSKLQYHSCPNLTTILKYTTLKSGLRLKISPLGCLANPQNETELKIVIKYVYFLIITNNFKGCIKWFKLYT